MTGRPRAFALAVLAAVAPPAAGAADDRGLPEGPAPLAYRVEVRVDADGRGYRGTLVLDAPGFGGTAQPPLPARWHLWLNAFSHDQTTWMRTASAERADVEGVLDAHPDPWGFLALDAVECRPRGGGAARPVSHRFVHPVVPNPLDRTVAELDLAPCGGGGAGPSLEVAFHGRLPAPFARTGAVDGWSTFAHALPQVVGVQGWRPVDAPFLGPTELFANFADWDVTVDAPAGATVVATGGPGEDVGDAPAGRARRRFRQRWATHFTFLVVRDVQIVEARHAPPGGRPVALRLVVPAARASHAARVLPAVRTGLDVLTGRVGAYPYDALTVVLPPPAAGHTAGMEYPTLVVGMPADPIWDRFPGLRLPELVAVHELAHQWFYGVVATNEMEEAWLDEGLTEYWTWEILRALYGEGRELGVVLGRPVAGDDAQSLRFADAATAVPVVSRPSYLVDPRDVGAHFYGRPSTLLRAAARAFGQGRVDATFRRWYARQRFRHPRGGRFLRTAAEAGGEAFGAFLRRGFEADAPPRFAVRSLRSEPWDPPRGRFAGEGAPVAADTWPDGAPPAPPTRPGAPLEVLERRPGAVARGPVPGGVRTLRWRWVRPPPLSPADAGAGLWRSRVRLETPGWPGWRTTARLRFGDGSVARGRLDDLRAPYRDLELVTRAPLTSVRLGRVPADPDPADDGLLAAPDRGLVDDLAGWVGAAVQWLAALGVWP